LPEGELTEEAEMKEQELLTMPISILPCYDIEEAEPARQLRTVGDDELNSHIRPMRTISLRDCAIPESK
jgi:hypothetical protein